MEGLLSELWAASDAQLEKAPAMTTATPPDLPWVWVVSGSLSYVFCSVVAALDPTPHGDVKSEWGWNNSFDWVWDMHQGGCGKPSSHLTTSFCPSWGQASVHVLLRSRIQASHSSPVSSNGPPASQGGASSRTGVPNP